MLVFLSRGTDLSLLVLGLSREMKRRESIEFANRGKMNNINCGNEEGARPEPHLGEGEKDGPDVSGCV